MSRTTELRAVNTGADQSRESRHFTPLHHVVHRYRNSWHLYGRQGVYNESMGKPTVAMQELAQKLIAFEEGANVEPDAGTHAPARVIEKMGTILTRFSGLDGYTALLRRAVALSRIEDPSLVVPRLVHTDSLVSFENCSSEATSNIIGHLLDLMCTFVGQSLTSRLLGEMWPVDDFGERLIP